MIDRLLQELDDCKKHLKDLNEISARLKKSDNAYMLVRVLTIETAGRIIDIDRELQEIGDEMEADWKREHPETIEIDQDF